MRPASPYLPGISAVESQQTSAEEIMDEYLWLWILLLILLCCCCAFCFYVAAWRRRKKYEELSAQWLPPVEEDAINLTSIQNRSSLAFIAPPPPPRAPTVVLDVQRREIASLEIDDGGFEELVVPRRMISVASAVEMVSTWRRRSSCVATTGTGPSSPTPALEEDLALPATGHPSRLFRARKGNKKALKDKKGKAASKYQSSGGASP